MDFEQLQKAIVINAQKYGEEFDIEIDRQFAVLKLVEEVGELAEAILTHEHKSRPEKILSSEEAETILAGELADVLGMTIVLADKFDLDLAEAINEKWIKKRK